MKHCRVCGTDKAKTEFNKNKARPDGLQTRCRDCQKDQNNRGYRYNSNRRDSIKLTRDANRAYNTKLMRRYKAFCGCSLCDEREPVALDLHHVDPAGKDENPSSLVTYSTDTMKKEIRKCIVLCSNCHRKVHAGILQISYKG